MAKIITMKGMRSYSLLIGFLLQGFFSNTQGINSTIPKGEKYAVGFKMTMLAIGNGDSMLVSTWYPAEAGKDEVTLRDLIARSAYHPGEDDAINRFKDILKRIYDKDVTDEKAFEKCLDKKMEAFHDATQLPGSFPLIIAASDPASHFETFTWFASHGFIVAGMHARFRQAEQDSAEPMKRYTDALSFLLNYMYDRPGTDKNSITAFGHGGGIQSAMYLSMRTKRIQRVINEDGGFFGPRSQTTASNDYRPDKFTIPLLHITTVSLQQEEDSLQFNAITSHITRIRIKPEMVWHHDFTVYGQVAGSCLGWRNGWVAIDKINEQLNYFMLQFARGKQLRNFSNDVFTIENFN
jgi:hypothetical protein